MESATVITEESGVLKASTVNEFLNHKGKG